MTRDGSGKPRTSLGDLTNQLGKRGFSLISRSPASKTAVSNNPKHVNQENDSPLAKRVALGCKDTGSSTKSPKAENSLPLLKGGKTYRLLSLGNTDSALDPTLKIGDQFSSAGANLGSVLPNVVATDGIKTTNSQSSSESSKHHFEMGGIGKSQDPEDPILEALGSQISSTEGKDSGFSTMPSTEYPPFVGSGLTNLQGPKPFELERCMWLKDDPASDALPDADSLHACSCSFCVKAAYIWSDLHYMDVKGRISALTKSKKEASSLVKMYSVDNNMSRGGEGSSSSSSQLDMDLMNRCKSLFVFMEDSFVKERNQLETKISSLKGIREDLKMNLGTVTEMPPDAQHFTSTDPSGRRMP